MSLIKCPECSKEISDQANHCVHCGYPIPKNTTVKQEPKYSAANVQPVQIVKEPMPQKTKNIIAISCAAVVLLIIGIFFWKTNADKAKAQERDLSYVFDITFDMTMEDVIAYETLTYGNTEYEFDSENNRLDFDSYEYGGKKKWKHKYFFDELTGLLTSAYYMDITVTFGGGSDAECEHIKDLKKALLDEIDEWDETTNEGLFKIAYGTIDGVECKIKYQDGSDKAFFIYRNDE